MCLRQKILATVLGAVYALSSLFCLCPHSHAALTETGTESHAQHGTPDPAHAGGCCDHAKHGADKHAGGEHRDGCGHCDGGKVLAAKAASFDLLQLSAIEPAFVPVERATEIAHLLRSTTSRFADPPGELWTPRPRLVLLRKSTLLI